MKSKIALIALALFSLVGSASAQSLLWSKTITAPAAGYSPYSMASASNGTACAVVLQWYADTGSGYKEQLLWFGNKGVSIYSGVINEDDNIISNIRGLSASCAVIGNTNYGALVAENYRVYSVAKSSSGTTVNISEISTGVNYNDNTMPDSTGFFTVAKSGNGVWVLSRYKY